MMSNRSSFSIGRYLGHQLKRSNYLFLIFSLVGLLLGPLITYLAINTNLTSAETITPAYLHNGIHSYMTGMGAFSIYFGAGLLGILFALFFSSYLNGKKSASFYHALPVKREGWLFSQILLGFVLFSMINLVVFIGTIGVLLFIGGFSNVPWLILLTHFLQSELFFLCSFSLSLLAGQLVGNTLGHLGMIGILQFGVSFFGMILYGFMHTFFRTFVESSVVTNLMKFSLPTGYIGFMERLSDKNVLYTNEAKEVLDFGLPYMGHMMIGLMAGVSILALLLSFVAYRARRLERASETLAFKPIDFPLKLYLGLMSGASFGLLLHGISNSVFFLFIGLLCGIVLLHIFYEMGVKRDVRAILKPINWLSTLVILIVAFGFGASFTTDAFGYDTYKPSKNAVLNASIEVNDAIGSEIIDDEGNRAVLLVEPENIKSLLDLAELGIANLDKVEDRHNITPVAYEAKEGELLEQNESYTWFTLSYTLAEGGKVKRQYEVPSKDFYAIFTKVFESPEYRGIVHELYQERLKAVTKVKFYDDYLDSEVLVLTPNDKARFEAFEKALLSDLSKRKVQGLDEQKLANVEFEGDNRFHSFEVFKSDKAVLALLEKLEAQKVTVSGHSFYIQSLPNFSRLVVTGPRKDDSYGELKTITDKKEIETYIKTKTLDQKASNYYRDDYDGRFEIVPYLSDGTTGKTRFFKQGEVPSEFL